jgi:hypothetical protein
MENDWEKNDWEKNDWDHFVNIDDNLIYYENISSNYDGEIIICRYKKEEKEKEEKKEKFSLDTKFNNPRLNRMISFIKFFYNIFSLGIYIKNSCKTMLSFGSIKK